MRVPRKCSKWSTTTTKIPYARSRNHCVHRRVYQQQMAWSATTSGNKQNDDVNNCNMFFVQWSDKRRPTQNCNCKYSIMPDQLATKKIAFHLHLRESYRFPASKSISVGRKLVSHSYISQGFYTFHQIDFTTYFWLMTLPTKVFRLL